MTWSRALAVGAGGMLGTWLRVVVDELAGGLVPAGATIPWGTAAVNVTGAAVLGFLAIWVVDRWGPYRWPLAALGTGLVGAYTTFSAFALEVAQHLPDDPAVAIVYGAGSVTVGVVAALGGSRLARRLTRHAAEGRA